MDPTQVSDSGQTGLTLVGGLGQRPKYPLSKAAQMAGVSLSTIKRKRAAGAFPNATQDHTGAWLIPVSDLLAAGYHLTGPLPQVSDPGQQAVAQVSDPGQTQEIARLERELLEAKTAYRIEQARREAAEQIAAEREKRAQTAERALLMLEARPAAAPMAAPVVVTAPETTMEPAPVAPRRSWWRRNR